MDIFPWEGNCLLVLHHVQIWLKGFKPVFPVYEQGGEFYIQYVWLLASVTSLILTETIGDKSR